MEKAADLVSKQQRYKYTRNDQRKIPHTLEWLCPKQGTHVNSVDSLLHSDDLLNEDSIKGKGIPLKDKYESCLRKKNVARWEGVVKRIKSDLQGTITFHRYIDVHFVPQSIRLSKPAIGDSVTFHLSFDWHGPRAWSVMRIADTNSYRKASSGQSSDDTEESDEEEQDHKNVYYMPAPLWCTPINESREANSWNDYVGKQMTGVVTTVRIEDRYGFLCHPDVEGGLYFSLNDVWVNIRQLMILKFHVANDVNGKLRAVDIDIPKVGVVPLRFIQSL